MKVEQISNYGKGLVEISLEPSYKKTKNQVSVLFLKRLYKEIGLIGTLDSFWKVSKEKKNSEKFDWSIVEDRGFEKENVNIVTEDLVLMKVLIIRLGENRACELFSKILKSINKELSNRKISQNILMIPSHEIKFCEDSFIGFKEFLLASEFAMEREGVHELEIIKNSKDELNFNVNYCVVNEVAKILGNPIYGFPWCHIDELALPMIGNELGFKYSRTGTLCLGASKCDFSFERV